MMKYYKDANNNVFAYDADGSQDEFIQEGLTAISESEAKAIASPTTTVDEIAAEVRAKRDRLLFESDWVVTRSVETGDPVPSAWLAYRQALRDIPEQEGFPQTINWPTAPEI